MPLTNLQECLRQYGEEAKAIYIRKITEGDHNASRDLISSVTARVEQDGKGWEVSLQLANYWKYLEGGSRGTEQTPAGAIYPAHMPPISALMRWIEVKPIIPRPKDNGKLPTPTQLAFAIGKTIERKGIAPYPALAETIEDLNAVYAEKLGIALALDCKDYLASILPQIGSLSQRI